MSVRFSHPPCCWLALPASRVLASPQAEVQVQVQAKAGALPNLAHVAKRQERAFASRESRSVCLIVGRDSLGGAASALEGGPLNGRPTQARRVLPGDEQSGFHTLYIEGNENWQVPMPLRTLDGRPVPTAGEMAGSADLGGTIAIELDDGRIGFDIHRSVLEQAPLRAISGLPLREGGVHDVTARQTPHATPASTVQAIAAAGPRARCEGVS